MFKSQISIKVGKTSKRKEKRMIQKMAKELDKIAKLMFSITSDNIEHYNEYITEMMDLGAPDAPISNIATDDLNQRYVEYRNSAFWSELLSKEKVNMDAHEVLLVTKYLKFFSPVLDMKLTKLKIKKLFSQKFDKCGTDLLVKFVDKLRNNPNELYVVYIQNDTNHGIHVFNKICELAQKDPSINANNKSISSSLEGMMNNVMDKISDEQKNMVTGFLDKFG